jgi:hypothetical protein
MVDDTQFEVLQSEMEKIFTSLEGGLHTHVEEW